jgi:hypothetical protein
LASGEIEPSFLSRWIAPGPKVFLLLFLQKKKILVFKKKRFVLALPAFAGPPRTTILGGVFHFQASFSG